MVLEITLMRTMSKFVLASLSFRQYILSYQKLCSSVVHRPVGVVLQLVCHTTQLTHSSHIQCTNPSIYVTDTHTRIHTRTGVHQYSV